MSAQRFVRVPVAVEAMRVDGTSAGEEAILRWADGMVTPFVGGGLGVNTSAGRREVRDGDWIVKDEDGELYPCSPNIFEETYEAMEATE